MMDKNGKGWPTWSQMDETGKGVFVMVILGLIATVGQWFYW